MKTIRTNVFETNSSTTHSLTLCTESDFLKWKSGELYYDSEDENFVTNEERIKILKKRIIRSRIKYIENDLYSYKGINIKNSDFASQLYTQENLAKITYKDIEEYLDENDDRYEIPQTYDEFMEDDYLETFEDDFKTPNGGIVVAFGKYGRDG